MIDSHCHLEQKDFDRDRKAVVEKCRKAGLKAVVTSCARPSDLQKTIDIVKQFPGFVFATAGLHPEFIKDFTQSQVEEFLEEIRDSKEHFVGIGEVGLDHHWVKENDWRQKQKELFVQLIGFAKEIRKPLVVHSWDACEDAVKVLEKEDAQRVLMHMFGDKSLVQRVADNGWYLSINTLILRNKNTRKIARDMPLGQVLLETDCPWLSPDVLLGKAERARNDPTSIRVAAEKIAEIRGITFDKVWKQGGKGAVRFYGLPVEV
jgi:TatD DNase family protein